MLQSKHNSTPLFVVLQLDCAVTCTVLYYYYHVRCKCQHFQTALLLELRAYHYQVSPPPPLRKRLMQTNAWKKKLKQFDRQPYCMEDIDLLLLRYKSVKYLQSFLISILSPPKNDRLVIIHKYTFSQQKKLCCLYKIFYFNFCNKENCLPSRLCDKYRKESNIQLAIYRKKKTTIMF